MNKFKRTDDAQPLLRLINDTNGDYNMATKYTFIIVHANDGAVLTNYDAAWLELGDDPTCWSEDKSKAKKFKTLEAAQKLMPLEGYCGFQPANIEMVQS